MMKIDHAGIPGVLLAGGLARRMGGGDKPMPRGGGRRGGGAGGGGGGKKPMRRIGGRTILERVIARLKPQCGELILSANGDPARFSEYGLPVIADTVKAFSGPLSGILAALDWAAAQRPGARFILSSAADCPFLPRDLVTRLASAQA